MNTPTRLCRACQGRPAMSRSNYCAQCFAEVYPEAAARAFETRVARSMDQMNEAYDTARQADEADAPVKRERWER